VYSVIYNFCTLSKVTSSSNRGLLNNGGGKGKDTSWLLMFIPGAHLMGADLYQKLEQYLYAHASKLKMVDELL
jgi:hypothetical protein